MKPKIVLAGVEYKSKKAAWDACRAILRKYHGMRGQRIGQEDEEIISDALLMHPEAEQKLSHGMAGIVIHENFAHGYGFSVLGDDGIETEFSLGACFGATSHVGEVRRAMRAAIVGQVIDFKTSQFKESARISCPVTGKETDYNNCWVDHTPPARFEALMNDFLSGRGVDVEKVEVSRVSGRVGERRLVDDTLRTEWQEYHRANAKLRIVAVGVV